MAESTHERPKRGNLKITIVVTLMAKHPELCILAVVVLLSLISNYGCSLKGKQLVAPPKVPKRFFPVSSSVIDFPFGTLGPISDILTDEELVFVMFYAPWCAESMRIRSEYQTAARVMQNRVKFVAVNCWWPEGHCHHHYKFFKYPELFVYHTHLDGFKYTGPMRAEYMVKFAEDLMHPITVLHSDEEIVKFTSRQDNTLIGFFDFNASPQPPGYTQFYYTAMRFIETGFLQSVKCGIITEPELALEFGFSEPKELVLVRTFNTSLLYPKENNFTSTAIQTWVNVYKQSPVVKWWSAPGVKSIQLSSQIEKGPTLLFFAPINLLHSSIYYYNMLREVALQYFKCEMVGFVDLFTDWSIAERKEIKEVFEKQKELCKHWSSDEAFQDELSKNCCMSLVGVNGKQNRKVCELCWYIARKIPLSVPNLCTFSLSSSFPEESVFGAIQTPSCLESAKYYNVNEYRTVCCKKCRYDLSVDSCVASQGRRSTDPFIIKSDKNFENMLCRKLTLQKIQNLINANQYIDDFDRNFMPVNFTGMSCNTNRTLQFLITEISDHKPFLKKMYPEWNLNVLQPVVILVDKQNEAQFVLKEQLSRKNLAIFIKNYTSSELQRHQRSEIDFQPCDVSQSNGCIQEATSKTFLDIVMQKDKDVVLFVYTEWCAFCSSLSHLYITLAKYFSSASNLVFSRINANKNDLPWEFTVDKYPTFLFFPAYRKADSVVFPDNVPKTLPNLIKFILNHAAKDLRMDTAVDLCSKTCIENNRDTSLRVLLKLRQKKTVIRRKLIELNSRRIRQGMTSASSNEKFFKVLWKLLKKLESQIRSAEMLQKYLTENSDGYLSKKQLLEKIARYTDSDQLQKESILHEEL